MMSPQIENPPAIVQPVKEKRKRRRSKSKRISEGVVAGVQFHSPVTRMVALFLNGLTAPEKAYALNLLLQMSRMEAKPIGQPRVIDTDTGKDVTPRVDTVAVSEAYAATRNEFNGRNRFVVR